MPDSKDRFYLMEMANRPALHGDVGSLIRIEGIVVGGGGGQAILMLPNQPLRVQFGTALDLEAWSDWLQRSDDPEILVGPAPNGSGASLPKIFHRKLRYEVSGAVQQKIWAADGFKCMYCHAAMGTSLMTVDHFIPLELGGVNNVTNYLSSCKRCNKLKGSQDPEEFLGPQKFNALKFYLAGRKMK